MVPKIDLDNIDTTINDTDLNDSDRKPERFHFLKVKLSQESKLKKPFFQQLINLLHTGD